VLVDLLGLTVLVEETAEHTDAADPNDLGGHTGIGRTLALTSAAVATLIIEFFLFKKKKAEVNTQKKKSTLRLLSMWARMRERECEAEGFLMIRPSLMSLRTFLRELALAIWVDSLGSIQT